MTGPDTSRTQTGRTVVGQNRNPNRNPGGTIDPAGTATSRTTQGQSANPGGHRGGPSPSREAGEDHTNTNSGTAPSPVKVDCGVKITHVNEP